MVVMIVKNALGEYGTSANDTIVCSVLGIDKDDCIKKFVNKYLKYDGKDWFDKYNDFMKQWRYMVFIEDMIE